jgi:hypothetical protein
VRYVKCFDSDGFRRAVEDEVRRQRAGHNYLAGMNPGKLKQAMDWSTAQESFLSLLRKLVGNGTPACRTAN